MNKTKIQILILNPYAYTWALRELQGERWKKRGCSWGKGVRVREREREREYGMERERERERTREGCIDRIHIQIQVHIYSFPTERKYNDNAYV